MKQALTAGGSISVWFESAKIALEKMGVSFEEDFELPGLKGTHPELGDIEIDFFIPVEGKTRMEITVPNAELIAAFKGNVVPAFRYVSDLLARQPEEEAEDEEEAEEADEAETTEEAEEAAADEAEQDVEAISGEAEPEEDQESDPEEATEAGDDAEEASEATEAEPQETAAEAVPETTDEPAAEEAEETKVSPVDVQEPQQPIEAADVEPQVQLCRHCQAQMKAGEKRCPVCGKKQKSSGGVIALIIVLVLLLIGAAGFAAYKYTGFSVTQIKSLIFGDGSSVTGMKISDGETSTQLITADQYTQVQIGLTYEKVCEIMGGSGIFLEPEVTLTYTNGDVVSLKTYYWNAEGDDGANVCITFRNGLVSTVSQYGMTN